jgi:hypothetical protein
MIEWTKESENDSENKAIRSCRKKSVCCSFRTLALLSENDIQTLGNLVIFCKCEIMHHVGKGLLNSE